MSSSKKTSKKAAPAVEDNKVEGATLQIDVDSFVRTRDSVVTGLATLQDAIQTLSTAYIKHTNAVLGEHGAGLEQGIDSALSKLGENPLLGGILNRGPSPPKTEVPEEKKERKKRQHDPNAPKRPLTPFFLYMQTARPIITTDLGPDAAKGAVSAEGTRRWKVMTEHDRTLWTNAYKDNLRLYNARIHSYKAGNVDAKDMSDEVALAYANSHNIQTPHTVDASAELLHEAPVIVEDLDAEGEEEVPTPPKTPKPKAVRKGRASKKVDPEPEEEDEPEVAKPTESIIPPPSTTKTATPAVATTDKKRKRASTAKAASKEVEAEEEEEAAPEPTPVPEKKTAKPRKKKAKADA